MFTNFATTIYFNSEHNPPHHTGWRWVIPNSIQWRINSLSPNGGGGINTDLIHFVLILVYFIIIALSWFWEYLSLTPYIMAIFWKQGQKWPRSHIYFWACWEGKQLRVRSTKKLNRFLKWGSQGISFVLWREQRKLLIQKPAMWIP